MLPQYGFQAATACWSALPRMLPWWEQSMLWCNPQAAAVMAARPATPGFSLTLSALNPHVFKQFIAFELELIAGRMQPLAQMLIGVR